ncbi:MAG: glycosyltransferase family 39 protein [Promethearchaeota archaeon]|jgi:uncharacterized membrane protein
MKFKKYELILLVILLTSLFIRIFELSAESLWADEFYSINLAGKSLTQIIRITSTKDFHPPLYYIILHYWTKIFGTSEFAARFPSAIFGFLSVFMIYKVGELIFNKEIGLLSSLILGLNIFHIHYSQDVRMYSQLTLLTLISFYYFIKLIKDINSKNSLLYLAATSFLLYTHVFGIFILIAQNIYLFLIFLSSNDFSKFYFKKWIFLQAILIFLYAPWILVLIKKVLATQQISKSNISWIPEPSIYSIYRSFKTYSSPYLRYIYLILAFISILDFGESKNISKSELKIQWPNSNWLSLLFIWLLTPIILPFIISKILMPIYWNRFTIGASLAFYILVSKGIMKIDRKLIQMGIISIILFISLWNVSQYYIDVKKEQWRDLADYIDKSAEDKDLVIFHIDHIKSFDYYSERQNIIKKPFPSKTRLVLEENVKELESTVKGHSRVWVVLSHSRDYESLITKTLEKSYTMIDYKKFVGIEVFLFERMARY